MGCHKGQSVSLARSNVYRRGRNTEVWRRDEEQRSQREKEGWISRSLSLQQWQACSKCMVAILKTSSQWESSNLKVIIWSDVCVTTGDTALSIESFVQCHNLQPQPLPQWGGIIIVCVTLAVSTLPDFEITQKVYFPDFTLEKRIHSHFVSAPPHFRRMRFS